MRNITLQEECTCDIEDFLEKLKYRKNVTLKKEAFCIKLHDFLNVSKFLENECRLSNKIVTLYVLLAFLVCGLVFWAIGFLCRGLRIPRSGRTWGEIVLDPSEIRILQRLSWTSYGTLRTSSSN